jgi:hypothetical protein
LPVTGARGPGFHGWDALTLGMTPATRLFPSGQAASYVDRILRGEKPDLRCPLYPQKRTLPERD